MKIECFERKGIDRRDAMISGGWLLVASAFMGEVRKSAAIGRPPLQGSSTRSAIYLASF